MIQELHQIDVSAVDELSEIRQQQRTLEERLELMEEKKSEVSRAVFKRVRSDYQSQYQTLEDQALPLKAQVRTEYAKVRDLYEKLTTALEETRNDKEELEFRHALGEFDEKLFADRLKECEENFNQRQAELTEAEQLKATFIAPFASEDELEAAPDVEIATEEESTGATELSPSAEEPRALPDEAEPVAAERDHPQAPWGPPIGQEPVAEPPPPAPPLPIDQGVTVRMVAATVTVQTGGETGTTYKLGFMPLSIGRQKECDIPLHGDSVSRRHAEIKMTAEGHRIFDLESGNGVYINGERVTEHQLADGDVIDIGDATASLVFRTG